MRASHALSIISSFHSAVHLPNLWIPLTSLSDHYRILRSCHNSCDCLELNKSHITQNAFHTPLHAPTGHLACLSHNVSSVIHQPPFMIRQPSPTLHHQSFIRNVRAGMPFGRQCPSYFQGRHLKPCPWHPPCVISLASFAFRETPPALGPVEVAICLIWSANV